jgi:hypothetical protein
MASRSGRLGAVPTVNRSFTAVGLGADGCLTGLYDGSIATAGMDRFAIELPTALGPGREEERLGRDDLEQPSKRFVRWFDCWAGL